MNGAACSPGDRQHASSTTATRTPQANPAPAPQAPQGQSAAQPHGGPTANSQPSIQPIAYYYPYGYGYNYGYSYYQTPSYWYGR